MNSPKPGRGLSARRSLATSAMLALFGLAAYAGGGTTPAFACHEYVSPVDGSAGCGAYRRDQSSGSTGGSSGGSTTDGSGSGSTDGSGGSTGGNTDSGSGGGGEQLPDTPSCEK
ncbi:hypothetical protein SH611_11805 [Geminicoccaceae bacterium 1502E]|nr:hypothetical protein [Geminicoccaceae bacterium 1502E]